MLGVGGRELSASHVVETAKVISLQTPDYFSFLTTMALPGSPYLQAVEKKIITPLTSKELLEEMYGIIAQIESTYPMTLRVNHISNMFPIAGILPQDRERVLETLEHWVKQEPEGNYPIVPNYY